LGHLRYNFADAPPQPNSPPDYVFRANQPSKKMTLDKKLAAMAMMMVMMVTVVVHDGDDHSTLQHVSWVSKNANWEHDRPIIMAIFEEEQRKQQRRACGAWILIPTIITHCWQTMRTGKASVAARGTLLNFQRPRILFGVVAECQPTAMHGLS